MHYEVDVDQFVKSQILCVALFTVTESITLHRPISGRDDMYK